MTLSARHTWLAGTLFAVAPSVFAVGFGSLPTEAVLGQPLRLSIPLRLEANEELPPECLSAQVFFADNLQQPGTTSLRLLPALPGSVDRTLSLSTTTRVDEPFVSVEVTVGCQARVSRRFTLFADPPVVAPAPVAEAAPPAALPAQRAASAQAAEPEEPSRTSVVPPPAALDRPLGEEPPPRAAPPRRRVVPQSTTTAPRPARAAPRPAEVASPALRLAPLERGAQAAAAASVAPTVPSTAAAPASAAAAEPGMSPATAAAASAAMEIAASAVAAEQAASAQAAAAQARVAELEASLQKLRSESASTQNIVAGLQARLARAQGEQAGDPIVYVLAAALALMLGAVLWLWRQRHADREAQSWLAQAHADSESAPLDAPAPATAETAAFAPVPTLKTWVSKPNEIDGFDDTLALTRAGTPHSTMPAPFRSQPIPLDSIQPLAAEANKREVSVEELIDLEQQAEFFVVLGQDSAAIDLLMGHLRSTSGTSPLPYLKLLEIYKRLGERDDYERLRERFNRRFNAYAPSWETDLLGGRSLEEYPAVIERLQSLWITPMRAREVLQATLVRPDNADTDPVGEDSFDLPAYRELMLLYSVIRDVSDFDDSVFGVDLMLPIDEDEAALRRDHGDAAAFERLLATTTMPAQPDVHKPLEMDLALDDLEESKPGEAGSLPPGRSGRDA